jgi:hypothetical protein
MSFFDIRWMFICGDDINFGFLPKSGMGGSRTGRVGEQKTRRRSDVLQHYARPVRKLRGNGLRKGDSAVQDIFERHEKQHTSICACDHGAAWQFRLCSPSVRLYSYGIVFPLTVTIVP